MIICLNFYIVMQSKAKTNTGNKFISQHWVLNQDFTRRDFQDFNFHKLTESSSLRLKLWAHWLGFKKREMVSCLVVSSFCSICILLFQGSNLNIEFIRVRWTLNLYILPFLRENSDSVFKCRYSSKRLYPFLQHLNSPKMLEKGKCPENANEFFVQK